MEIHKRESLRRPLAVIRSLQQTHDLVFQMSDDHIRYDILVQDALRGVMRKVLTEVASTGLPGSHHFFITFMTHAPGVKVSSRLLEKYPEQMTIVLQYQFWDLKVTDAHFEIGLSFGDTPEKLYVPFTAVRGFYDPHVNFELEFDVDAAEATEAPQENKLSVVGEEQEKPTTDPTSDATDDTPSEDAEDSEKTADVVSLDAFRRKDTK